MARYRGMFSYFVKTHSAEDDYELHAYSGIPINGWLFENIASMSNPSNSLKAVFICDGANEALSRQIDEVVPTLQAELERAGAKLSGLPLCS